MGTMKVKLTFNTELLGTASSDKDIHKNFIASKAPNATSREEEVAAIGADAVVEKTATVFPRDACGMPIVWDYQIKGFFKDACGMLSRASSTASSTLKAYRKIIDGLVFIEEREIPFILPEGGEVGRCQRPLRAQTAQGERIALANSETLPAGTTLEFTIETYELKGKEDLEACVKEWLDYGRKRGIGQWRGSGRGRFTWEIVDK